MQIAEYPVKVPISSARLAPVSWVSMRHERALLRADLHAGGIGEPAGRLGRQLG